MKIRSCWYFCWFFCGVIYIVFQGWSGGAVLLHQPFVVVVDPVQVHLEVLAVFLDHDLELESGKEGLDGGDHGETADHEGGDPGDEAGVEVLAHDRDEKGDGDDGHDGSDDAEKGHGIVGAVESGDGAQDAQAV